jgi:HD-GYP domain-containing protein (c-di-GMP phosphodiesterase class II)
VLNLTKKCEAPFPGLDSQSHLQLLDPLNVLDNFIQELESCDQARKQLRLLLKAIADSVRADAVFVQSTIVPEMFESVGRFPLDAEWCRQLIRRLLLDASAVEHQLLRSKPGIPAGPACPAPQSVAMVQVSRSRNTWVVALGFSPTQRFYSLDIKLMALARRLLVSHSRQIRAADKLKETLLGLIHCLTASIDAKDPYTCGHSERVARIATRLGLNLAVPDRLVSDLYLAGLLHDIGKIGIKDSVLQKPGKLTEEERALVQEHPVIGDRIISNVSQLAHVRPGVRSHHERYDGRGYPDGLVGESIPLLARILAVADSCDAMMSARPYRPALATRQIEATLIQGAGSQWDPRVIDAFMSCRKELYPICQRGIGDSICLAVDHALRADREASWHKSSTGEFFVAESKSGLLG